METPSKPRVMPPVWMLAAILFQYGLARWFPGPRVVPPGWEWLRNAALLVAAALFFGAVALFMRHRTTLEPGRESSTLIQGGPYRLSRNPIYLGMLCMVLGAALQFAVLTPFLVLPAFVWVITTQIIAVEERMLSERFGAAYTAYCRRVRRWI